MATLPHPSRVAIWDIDVAHDLRVDGRFGGPAARPAAFPPATWLHIAGVVALMPPALLVYLLVATRRRRARRRRSLRQATVHNAGRRQTVCRVTRR